MSATRRGRRAAGPREAPPGVALTVTQAARACRVSPAAIQRWIDTGIFPSAAPSDGGGWTVPVADLEGAGLRPRLHLYKRVAAIRILFGVIFVIDAFLKWRPGFASSFLSQVTAAAQGQPAWLLPWFHFWARFIALAPAPFAYLSAITESLIGVALLLGLARQVTYFAAAAYAFFLWAIPEGFGGPYKGGATDIGTGIIYVIVFLALYQLDTLADESPWSLDPVIERRFPWWRRLSEPSLRVKGGGAGAAPAEARARVTAAARWTSAQGTLTVIAQRGAPPSATVAAT